MRTKTRVIKLKQMKKKLLLIDDKQEFRRLTKIILSKDFEITTAENGMQALISMQKGAIPDLIVCDVNMPELDGEQFVKQLKASGMFQHIPIIMLSSNDKSADKISLMKAGADDYLTKPYNPEELMLRINYKLKTAIQPENFLL